MTKTPAKPPAHLSAAMRKWWSSVIENYDLEEHHRKLLTLACEAHDRCADARETIAKSGAFFTNFHGEPRVHPAVNVERDARLSFARLLRELGLDGGPVADDARQPRLGGR